MAGNSGSPDLAQVFAALADPTRLRLLNLIAGREVCVCYLVKVLRMSQPKISRHLAYLRKAGVVQARREGKWMHYRLRELGDPETAGILTAVLAALRREKPMQADEAKLARACCVPQKLVLPTGAPLPATVAGAERTARGEARR